MLSRLIPASKDQKFFDMFEAMAALIKDSAGLLLELFRAEIPNYPEYARRIKLMEHQGDQITHDILDELNRTFITPFDREDIHNLACALDDVLDLIDAVAARLVLFNISKPISSTAELSKVLHEQGEVLIQTLTHLKDNHSVLQRCVQIHTLENEADTIFHQAIARLFVLEKNPITLIKEKEILETLEAATDLC
ncbi:MAG: DUF47 family protein, partial [Acidobacteria bacterium]|nr:DUF47 family protein [Acidobacteriota bacterium]